MLGFVFKYEQKFIVRSKNEAKNVTSHITLKTVLPCIDPLHSQMHALDRFRRDSSSNVNLLLRILHFKPEPSHDTGNGTTQFGTSKVLANTRPLAMQEGNLSVVGARTSRLVGGLLARGGIRVDPAFGQELVAILAPEIRAAVDGVRAQHQTGAGWHGLAGYCRVADGLADGHGHGGIQTQDFLAHPVQERKSLQVCPGDG